MRDAGIDWRDVPESVRRYSELPIELRDALAAGWPVRGTRRSQLMAVLKLALDFGTWRVLTRDARLDQDEAVELMIDLVICTARTTNLPANADVPRRRVPKERRLRPLR